MAEGLRIRQDRVRRAFDRVAPNFSSGDFLYRELARRMSERLDVVRITPQRILDLGCGVGADRRILQQRYPQATWLGLDHSQSMLKTGRRTAQAALGFLQRLRATRTFQSQKSHWLQGDMACLPLAGQSMDLIWSNAVLHWANDLPTVLAECQRVLSVGGLLMLSTFGPDTLKELRQAAQAAATSRTQSFTDMHDIGDMLVHAGFSDPVMDMETLTLTYADPWQALKELKQAGSTVAHNAVWGGLTTRKHWEAICAHWPRDVDGRYPLTFELVQGHAWKMAPRQIEDGRSVVNFMKRPPAKPAS